MTRLAIGTAAQILTVSTALLPAWSAALGSTSWPGQCRLTYVTSSQIRLDAYGGNLITIKSSGGTWQTVSLPSSGVSLSSTTFSNATSMNYIYAFSTALTLVGMTSSFPHSASTATGVEILTSDDTRTLVGMIYTSTAAGFYSTLGTTG